jgi:hypothetical protein
MFDEVMRFDTRVEKPLQRQLFANRPCMNPKRLNCYTHLKYIQKQKESGVQLWDVCPKQLLWVTVGKQRFYYDQAR